MERHVLQPGVVERAIEIASVRLALATRNAELQRDALKARIATLTQELDRLTSAIVAGGEVATLMSAMRRREAEKLAAERELAGLEQSARTTWDAKAIDREANAATSARDQCRTALSIKHFSSGYGLGEQCLWRAMQS